MNLYHDSKTNTDILDTKYKIIGVFTQHGTPGWSFGFWKTNKYKFAERVDMHLAWIKKALNGGKSKCREWDLTPLIHATPESDPSGWTDPAINVNLVTHANAGHSSINIDSDAPTVNEQEFQRYVNSFKGGPKNS